MHELEAPKAFAAVRIVMLLRRGLPVFLMKGSVCAGNPEEQLCLISPKTVPDFVL